MSVLLLQRYIAPAYRKPLVYALLLHSILLLTLVFSAVHPRHPLAISSPTAPALKAVMISTAALQPPALKVKKTDGLKHHHHVVHHKPGKIHHQKVATKKVIQKKTSHKHTVHKHAVTVKKATKSTKPIAKRHTTTTRKPTAAAQQHSKVSSVHKTTVQPKVSEKTKPAPPVKKVSVPKPKSKPEIKKAVTAKPTKSANQLKPAIAHATAATTTKNNTAPPMSRSEINRYTAQIIQAIGEHWIIPVGADPSLSCRLDIMLAEGGEVLSVNLVRSSGNPALDRSAVTAVLQASPLPVPTGADFSLFRHIRLTVRPESVT